MTSIAPIDSQQRLGELDVLRGFALLGVFIVHFVGAAFYTLPLDTAIAEAWQAEPWHFLALFVTDIFFYDKANTLSQPCSAWVSGSCSIGSGRAAATSNASTFAGCWRCCCWVWPTFS